MNSLADKYPNLDGAKNLLNSRSFVPATSLVVSCDIITEGACFVWEIESILEELEEEDCLPDVNNRDRLLGGISCLKNPLFLWNTQAFMVLAQTFSGVVSIPEIWEPLSPGQLAMCIEELDALYGAYNNTSKLAPLYNEDPKIFIAGCCYKAGLGELPTALSMCSDQFDRFFARELLLEEIVNNKTQTRKHEEIQLYTQQVRKLRESTMRKLKKEPAPALKSPTTQASPINSPPRSL
tara:strand:+ start:164 stop:874 length:711 start_codon:yes stop_codon:yes gene_type:complete